MSERNRIYFKDIGRYVLEPISFYVKVFTPDFYMGMHNHSYFEFMYAEKGSFTIETMKDPEKIDQSEIASLTVHQGEFIFIDAYLFHRLKITDENATIYNIELEPKSPEEYNPFNVNALMPIRYNALIEETNLKNIAKATSGGGYTILSDNSKVLLAFHNLITSLLKNNLNKKITLAMAAEAAGISKEYLAAQFKKMTGKTVLQTLTLMRISKSLQLLRESNFPVTEIARQAGFSSYGQMLYEFRKCTGITPTECRASFFTDEIDHTSQLYKSVAIRVNEEDFLLDDDAFYHAFFKKDIGK